jgi:L-alanine-DL-glutamate epimerase-like enolase superfamily enzyme
VPSRHCCALSREILADQPPDHCTELAQPLAQLHFASAIRNTTYFEVLLPHGAHKYALLEDIEIGRDGLARCPQVPGIGAEIDSDLIKRKKTAHLR